MKKEQEAPKEMDTPKEIVKYILPMIKGKRFCDLGCGNGNFLKEVSKHCDAIGIEMYEKDLKTARSKGLKVKEGNVRKMDLPEADVYYNFTYYHDIEDVVDNVKQGILIIGGTPEKFESYPKVVNRGIIIDIPKVNWRLWLIKK